MLRCDLRRKKQTIALLMRSLTGDLHTQRKVTAAWIVGVHVFGSINIQSMRVELCKSLKNVKQNTAKWESYICSNVKIDENYDLKTIVL